ncbi:PPE family protein [Mycobacterium intracellulare]|uniref:PPE family protein n=1 Tax=Mycobacterium intracellulare TaxID=1767 RepID=UPI0009B84A7A
MDFGALPPEINSARMYSGPGSASMLAAAVTWDTLAVELSLVATSYWSIVTELTGGQWRGPSSVSMAAAAAPYIAWLHDTAQQAERTASQAKEAAAAYELAFVMTVPPSVIAANRSLLMTLVATNFFGQNSPAIAATEAQYAEMWVQDAVAMYDYAETSSAARVLVPFHPPGPTTNRSGLTAQSEAAAQAVSDSAVPQPMTLVQLSSQASTAPAQLFAPAAASDPLVTPQALVIAALTPPRFVNMALGYSSAATSGRGIAIVDERLAFQDARDAASPPGSRGAAGSGTRPGISMVSAALGRAAPVGSLSVPSAWTTAAPDVRHVALALPDSPVPTTGTVANVPQATGNSFSQALLGTLSREEGADARRQKSRPIIVRSPAAG